MATEAKETKEILEELKALKSDIAFIKEHMFDPDTIMTIGEKKRYDQAMKEFREGKTISLKSLKKQLGL